MEAPPPAPLLVPCSFVRVSVIYISSHGMVLGLHPVQDLVKCVAMTILDVLGGSNATQHPFRLCTWWPQTGFSGILFQGFPASPSFLGKQRHQGLCDGFPILNMHTVLLSVNYPLERMSWHPGGASGHACG